MNCHVMIVWKIGRGMKCDEKILCVDKIYQPFEK